MHDLENIFTSVLSGGGKLIKDNNSQTGACIRATWGGSLKHTEQSTILRDALSGPRKGLQVGVSNEILVVSHTTCLWTILREELV